MTVMVGIPINADVLQWAIVDARSTPEKLEDRCSFEHGVVESWVTGQTKPNTGELKKLSHALGRPFQFFLLPEIPQDAPVEARFRRSLHVDSPDPEKEVAALRIARRAQDFASWAGFDPNSLDLLPKLPDEAAAAYAARLTSHLGWTLRLQRTATSKSAVFRLLRERIEALGVIVMLQPAGKRNFRGFSLDRTPPLIYINKDYSGAALRSFTLLHELAHLGAGSGNRSCYYDDTGQERWCNQVATEVLLPKAPFIEFVRAKGIHQVNEANLDVVESASKYFKASWLAVAIRLSEVGLADRDLVDFVRQNYDLERDPSAPIPGIDRSTPVLRREEFGANYLRLVRRAVAESRMTEFEAGKLLRANSQQLQSIWQYTSEAG